jgi:hypothetical protein
LSPIGPSPYKFTLFARYFQNDYIGFSTPRTDFRLPQRAGRSGIFSGVVSADMVLWLFKRGQGIGTQMGLKRKTKTQPFKFFRHSG